MLSCDAEELLTWTMLLNFHMEENPHRGVTDFLTRAENALDPAFKVGNSQKSRKNDSLTIA